MMGLLLVWGAIVLGETVLGTVDLLTNYENPRVSFIKADVYVYMEMLAYSKYM